MKTLVLSLLATTVPLVFFLLTSDFYWNTGPVSATPVMQTRSSQTLLQTENASRHEHRSDFDFNQSLSGIQDKTGSTITPSVQTQAPEPAPVMLWELERIVALENQSTESAFSELLTMLSHDNPVIRLAAIKSMGDMTYQPTIPALTAVLDDPDPALRIATLEALASQEDESVAGSIEPYLYDQDRHVRIAAIEALVNIELRSTIHVLAGLLTDQDPLIRHQAVYALGEYGGDLSYQYLQQVRDDPNPSVRMYAISILREIN